MVLLTYDRVTHVHKVGHALLTLFVVTVVPGCVAIFCHVGDPRMQKASRPLPVRRSCSHLIRSNGISGAVLIMSGLVLHALQGMQQQA